MDEPPLVFQLTGTVDLTFAEQATKFSPRAIGRVCQKACQVKDAGSINRSQ